MKLWIDDVRQPPNYDKLSCDWLWCKSVNQVKVAIDWYEHSLSDDTIILDLDHDAGDFAFDGGDYIKILDWLESEGIVDTGYFFHIHSQNVVGVQNMRAIIQHNGWREIK